MMVLSVLIFPLYMADEKLEEGGVHWAAWAAIVVFPRR